MRRAFEYEANDGTRFGTAAECRRHEHNFKLKSLVHMTDEQLVTALERTDIPLADAIEFAGKLISDKRRAMGDLKHKKKAVAEKPAESVATITAMKKKVPILKKANK